MSAGSRARVLEGGTLDDYEIEEEIHNGGSSRILLAQCRTGRLRNRKIVLKQVVSSASSAHRVAAALHQGLCHPNIISLYSIVHKPSTHYVLEYCPEGSLDSIVSSRGPLSESQIRNILKNVVDALLYLRKELVVHRNIKPSAVLLTDSMKAKLSNFTLARRLPSAISELYESMQSTSAYTAPEILLGTPYSFPADVWSLGSVIVYCILGERVSKEDNKVTELLDSRGVSPEVVSLLEGMLLKVAKQRTCITEIATHPSLTNASDKRSFATSDTPRDRDRKILGTAGSWRRNITVGSSIAARSRLYGTEIRRPQFLMGVMTRRSASDPLPRLTDAEESSLSENDALPTRSRMLIAANPFTNMSNKESGQLGSMSTSESENETGKQGSYSLRDQVNAVRTRSSSTHDKENNPCPAPDTELVVGCTRPVPFDTTLLAPKVHKTTHGTLTILQSGSLLVDFRECQRRAKQKGEEVIVIDRTGLKVSVYHAPHLSTPCCLVEPRNTYDLDSLPKSYWKQYNDANKLVDQVKEKTPKVVLYHAHAKYTLMANGPPGNVEVLSWLSTHRLEHSPGLEPIRDPTKSPHVRIRINRSKGSAEVARYIDRDGSAEWTKKTFGFPAHDSELWWHNLDMLEQAVMLHAKEFIKNCAIFETPNGVDNHPGRNTDKGQQEKESLELLKPTILLPNSGEQSRKVSETLVEINMAWNKQRMSNDSKVPRGMDPDKLRANDLPLGPDPLNRDTKYIPSVGWCIRQNLNPSSKGGNYRILFLDGVTMKVDVDEEWVEYVSQSGDVTCHDIRGAMGRRKIGDRFKVFEEFVSLYEDHT